MNCRGCGAKLTLTFLDLGMSPIANNLVEDKQLNHRNKSYPLRAMTCEKCALVQLSEAIKDGSLTITGNAQSVISALGVFEISSLQQ